MAVRSAGLAVVAVAGSIAVSGCGQVVLESQTAETSGSTAGPGGAGAAGDGGVGGLGGSGGEGLTLSGIGGAGGGAAPVACSPAPLSGAVPSVPLPVGVTADLAGAGKVVRAVVSPDGDGVIAFGDEERIVVRRHHLGQWGAPELVALAPDAATGKELLWASLLVAAGADGRVLIVYPERRAPKFALCARTFEPGAGWSDPELLGVTDEGWWQDPVAPDPVAAMNAGGDAIVVWNGGPEDGDGMFARRLSAGAGWGQVETIEAGYGADPAVVLLEDASAVAAWRRPGGAVARAFDPVAGWGPDEELGAEASRPRLSIGEGQSTVAVWEEPTMSGYMVETAERAPGSGWSPAALLDDVAGPPEPLLATAGSGSGVAGWSSLVIECEVQARVQLRGAGGDWQVATGIPEIGDAPARVSSVAANEAGQAVVAWQRSVPGACTWQGAHLSHYRPATGTWGTLELDPEAGSGGLEAALAPDGRALVGWRRVVDELVLVRWVDPASLP